MSSEALGTVWLCDCCTLTLANGECETHGEHGGPEPLGAIGDADITLGLLWEEHSEDCPRRNGDEEAECDCEERTFSWAQCDGCGSTLGGSRHGATLWERQPRNA